LQLANDTLRLRLDPRTGAIASLLHQDLPGNLADTTSDKAAGLNDYLYHLGRDDKQGFQRIESPPTITVQDAGPLVATLKIQSDAPGCKSLQRQIRLVDGSHRVYITNTTDKLKERRPEGVYFSYPFNIPNAIARIDIPWAVAQVEKDQIAGANRNYYCVQRWADLSNDDYGVTWVTLDAPMLQFDPIKIAEAWGLQYWRTEIDPSPFFYSWVMNNHWETNYKADQEGIIRFRYVLAPHAGSYDPVRAQRTAREEHQPLIPISSDPDLPVVAPLLKIDGDGIIVTSVRPSQDGQALLVRLFNVADQPCSARVAPLSANGQIWISNPMEEKVRPAPAELELVRFEMATLRLER
jgi:alpha-mannosidase